MKKTTFVILTLPIVCLVYKNAYSQSGLNKSQAELLNFISRPAYTSRYPKVVVTDQLVTSFTADSSERVQYYLNSFKRCNLEIMGEKLELENRRSKLEFLLAYLKALNFSPNLDSDNKFINNNQRMIALIEEKEGWLNIEFKKF